MALNYTITIKQLGNTKTHSGRVADLNELSAVIQDVNNDNIKGEQAIVTITYSAVSQAELDYEKKINELGGK